MKQKDRIPSSKTYENMGLWLYRKKLCYTTNGFGSKWMPTFVKRKIVCVWNKISCFIFGHFWFPDSDPKNGGIWKNKKLLNFKFYVCCDCMKRKNKNG